jgi:hypothetical protein
MLEARFSQGWPNPSERGIVRSLVSALRMEASRKPRHPAPRGTLQRRTPRTNRTPLDQFPHRRRRIERLPRTAAAGRTRTLSLDHLPYVSSMRPCVLRIQFLSAFYWWYSSRGSAPCALRSRGNTRGVTTQGHRGEINQSFVPLPRLRLPGAASGFDTGSAD